MALAEEQRMEIGLYVAVSDLDTSRKFYDRLFEKEPYMQTPNFAGYQISGGRFGLFLDSAYAFPLERGNSTVPNIKVADIESEFARVKALSPTKMQDQIVDVGPTKIFMFADPDGNVIEFFSVAL